MVDDEKWLAILCGEIADETAPFLPEERLQITTNGRSGRRIMEDAFRFRTS